MAKFVYFTPEEKARAQNTDLVSLLRAQGGGSTVPRSDCGWTSAALALTRRNATIFRNIP